MEIVGEKYHNTIRFVECTCSCGGSFFAVADDISYGTVRSCAHEFAGLDIDRIFKKRFPYFERDREDAIRLNAYLQWEAEGCPEDSAWDFWLNAEEQFDYPVTQPRGGR